MGRKAFHVPEGISTVTTYAELGGLVSGFVEGHIPLLAILGTPGLSKSQTLRAAIGNRRCLFVKGRKSALSFYTSLYEFKDEPVLIDDADDLMGQKQCRSYIKALTETDTFKRLDYDTKTKILEEEGVPKHFVTTSPTCIITNAWSDNDPIYGALASRAELVYFAPDWNEVYRQCATWFWDQEILDYIHARLSTLRTPDLRIVTKAWNRKRAGSPLLDWRKAIDDHCDDTAGLLLRKLLDDPRHKTNTVRCKLWCEETGKDRATFYRHMAEVKGYRPKATQERLLVTRTTPPLTLRPVDAHVPDAEESLSDDA